MDLTGIDAHGTTPLSPPAQVDPRPERPSDAGPSAHPSVVVDLGTDEAPDPVRLWLLDVGLACCAVEFHAAAMAQTALDELGVVSAYAEGPDTANVLVISGTVTAPMAPAVRALYEQMPEPRHVVSFGACSNSGGPYWDSYSVVAGVDTLIPVDVYVPGCPPRPEALLDGLRVLRAQMSAHPEGRAPARPGPA
jgi:NADH-quinone oxidoreductase subunit B